MRLVHKIKIKLNNNTWNHVNPNLNMDYLSNSIGFVCPECQGSHVLLAITLSPFQTVLRTVFFFCV